MQYERSVRVPFDLSGAFTVWQSNFAGAFVSWRDRSICGVKFDVVLHVVFVFMLAVYETLCVGLADIHAV